MKLRSPRTRATPLLLALAAALAFPAVALAAPAITVTPASGAPRAAVTVAGTGFGASQAVDIYFDTADRCLALTDGAGAFSCAVSVPTTAQPGSHWWSAVRRSDGTGAQKSFFVGANWPQFHGLNGNHRGVNTLENTLNTGNVDDLEELLWSARIGTSGTLGSVAVAGLSLYVGGVDGKLYGLNARTGAALAGFPVTLPGPIRSSTPAVGGGRVFVGADSRLHAFNATTGAPAGAPFPILLAGATLVLSSPALALGNVYIGADDGRLYAFNATTGAAVSGFPVTMRAGASVQVAPTVANGNVYAGINAATAGTMFFGFDALTGTVAPGFPKTIGAVTATAAASNGAVFVGSHDHGLYAFDATSGAVVAGFAVATGGAIDSSPAVAGGRVFVGSGDGKLYAFPVSGGASVWTATLDTGVGGSPAVANGVVYATTVRRTYALARSNGAILWTANVGGRSTTSQNSPVVVNGILYLGSKDGHVYAFSVDGELPVPSSASGAGRALERAPRLSSLEPDRSLKPRRARSR